MEVESAAAGQNGDIEERVNVAATPASTAARPTAPASSPANPSQQYRKPTPGEVQRAAYVCGISADNKSYTGLDTTLASYFPAVPKNIIDAAPDAFFRRYVTQTAGSQLADSPVLCRAINHAPRNAADLVPHVTKLVALNSAMRDGNENKPGYLEDTGNALRGQFLKVMGAWDKGAVWLSDQFPDWLPGKMSAEERQFYLDRGTYAQQLANDPKNQGQTWPGMLAGGASYLLLGEAAPWVAAGSEGTAHTQDLEDHDVDPATARKLGIEQGMLSLLASYLPLLKLDTGSAAALLRSLPRSSATAAATGVAQYLLGS